MFFYLKAKRQDAPWKSQFYLEVFSFLTLTEEQNYILQIIEHLL